MNSVPDLMCTTWSYLKIRSPSSGELLVFQLAEDRFQRSRATICSRNNEIYLRQKLSERHNTPTRSLFSMKKEIMCRSVELHPRRWRFVLDCCSEYVRGVFCLGTLIIDRSRYALGSRSKHNRPRRTTAQTKARHSQRLGDRLANSMPDVRRNADPVML